ncbi:MAG TPA: GIY-YIG nuclease family protein [Candidatus Paceibacterota bacterium]|nr:GIY-YIG nuclease family protein [Candidatus Pacearchaeota archaeon]HRZ50587.1 GIY-YIG nuclease family protein [Candidatus Paceibacterota bacterium]HSA36308.1 GIY-YIG nuclease family protein [Candidatus Paceibacterota bacterium]
MREQDKKAFLPKDAALKNQIDRLPDRSGVYFFKDGKESILYVGKAKNLKKRVISHFSRPEQHAWDFMSQVSRVDFIETANENDALLVESQLIKKYQPKFNVVWKDDKAYFYVAATKEKFPRVFITHQPKNIEVSRLAGPFTRGAELKTLLKELRKIFLFRTCRHIPKKPCLYYSLALCPAPCLNKRIGARYGQSIDALFALLALYRPDKLRIEGYDISNISGTLAVGSMAVFEGGHRKASDYRKFKIRTVEGQNDVASLKEIFSRRQKHAEWPKAGLVLLDGGKGQLKAARGYLGPVIALAKIQRSSGKIFSPFSKTFVLLDKLPRDLRNILLRVRDEAHRFAITYHKSRREKLISDNK